MDGGRRIHGGRDREHNGYMGRPPFQQHGGRNGGYNGNDMGRPPFQHHGGRDGGHDVYMERPRHVNLQPQDIEYIFIQNPTVSIDYVYNNERIRQIIINLIHKRAINRFNRNFNEADRLTTLLRKKFAVEVIDYPKYRSGNWRVNEGLWRKISEHFTSPSGQRGEEHHEQRQREVEQQQHEVEAENGLAYPANAEEENDEGDATEVEQQQHEVEAENGLAYPANAEEDMIPDGNEYAVGGENENYSPHEDTDSLVATENDEGDATVMMEFRPTTTTMKSNVQKNATIAAAGSAEQRSDKVSWPVAVQRTSSRTNIFKGTMKEPSDSIAGLFKSNNNNVSRDNEGSSSKRRGARQQSSRHSSLETKTEEDEDEVGKKKRRTMDDDDDDDDSNDDNNHISNSNNNVDISMTTPVKQQITDQELNSYLEKDPTPINNNFKRDDISISSANSSNNSDDSYVYDLCGIFVPNNPTRFNLSEDEKNILRCINKLQQLKNKVRTREEDIQYKNYTDRLYELCPKVSRGTPPYPQFVPKRRTDHFFPTITGEGGGVNGGKGGLVIDDASTSQERPTDDDMIKYFNDDNNRISIGLRVRFKDAPKIYFKHHEFRTPHRNSRLIVSEEGDTIWTWIYNGEIYIRSKGGKDLLKNSYSKLTYPTMNGLMKSEKEKRAEGKKKESLKIHHLVFVTFSDDEVVERYLGVGLEIDHINRKKEDCRWVNLRIVKHRDNMKNRGVKVFKGHV